MKIDNESDLLKIIDDFIKKYPITAAVGSCLSISYDFQEYIRREYSINTISIQFGTLDGHRHSWVEIWTDKLPLTLVDLTADQFGEEYPHVIVGLHYDVLKAYGYKYEDEDEA